MSHRVTVQTEMKDKQHVLAALKDAKVDFKEDGDTIRLSGNGYRDATINLKTGQVVSGDVDHGGVDESKLGLLRQAYAKVKYEAECFEKGVTINSTEIVTHNGVRGVIKMSCRMA